MKLIIDIQEEAYKNTCNESMLPPDVTNVINAIKNGIPLEEKDDCDSCKFNSRPNYAKPCCDCYMNQEVVENHFISKED